MNLVLFVFRSVCNQISLNFQGFFCFFFFFHKVRHSKVRKVTDSGFWKKVEMGSDGSKNPHKMWFLGFQ